MSYYDDNGTLMRDDGRFRCQACIECKYLSELSLKDARYCTFCQPIIEEEYRAIAERLGRANKYKPQPTQKPTEMTEIGVTPNSLSATPETKMSTLDEKPITVDNFRPRGRPKHYKKRELPIELIEQLHSKDIGSKAITTLLKREQGIEVSYKTIQRILSGER
jgi:hypothetical protein